MKTTKRDKILNALDKVTDGVEEILNSMKIESNPDPHRELREAQERGETIQLHHSGWQDLLEPTDFPYSPDRYRIKPLECNRRVKPKKKLYLWAYSRENEGLWHQTKEYSECFDGFMHNRAFLSGCVGKEGARVIATKAGSTTITLPGAIEGQESKVFYFKRIDSTMIEVEV